MFRSVSRLCFSWKPLLRRVVKCPGGINYRTFKGNRRLWLEQLEERLAPASNIQLENVSLVDANLNPVTVASAGQNVYVEARYTTQDLSTTASYRLSYTVNGVTRYSPYYNSGAGSAGTYSWIDNSLYFIASPGSNQATVTVDPEQSVPETTYDDNSLSFTFNALFPAAGSFSYSVSQIRSAYGINKIPDFGAATPDGTGQTIAIVDAYNDPNIFSDLDGFDQRMNLASNFSPTLYQQYGFASSFLTVYNQPGNDISSNIAQSGVNGVPQSDPSGSWELEETIDVEWRHAIAPGARIDLIECDGVRSNLFAGAAIASKLSGVTVVSMSWGWSEGSLGAQQELAYDSSVFANLGVTYLASTGDYGMPGSYPAFSSNVVAVGGTQLIVDGSADTYSYDGEIGWSFPIPPALDYGSKYYAQNGTWGFQSGGFSGFYGSAQAGTNSIATWTASVSATNENKDGGTEVSTTWVADPSNATNASYTIYDGAGLSGPVLGTYVIDQTKNAIGTVEGSSQFQELGVVYPTLTNGTGSVTIALNTNPLSGDPANGRVIADAVGIAPAWAGAGGQSQNEAEPKYQIAFQNAGHRMTPDVSFDGSSSTGATCFQNGIIKYDYYGTSLACPCWAGVIAIANQGRVASGVPTLNSGGNPMQTLQALYSLPAADFNDVTSGYNGFSATPGYDQITGRGSPIANSLVPDLVSYGLTTPTEFKVSVLGANSVVAGTPFLIAVQAANQFGSPVNNFTGTATLMTTDPSVPALPTVTLTNGFGVVFGALKTAAGGPWTITATSGSLTGSFGTIAVTPAHAVHFKVDTPTTAVTNASFPVTVTALDAFGNVATNYTGAVNLTSTDSAAVAANDLGGSYTFTTGPGQDNGMHVFNVQLLTEGNQKITVADTTATIPAIVGTSAAIATSGLMVTALTKTPTGFMAAFNQAINPADLTIYGKGTTQQDVLLVGTNHQQRPALSGHARSSMPRKSWSRSTSRPIF